MAGRGTDIKLTPEAKAAGGLAIIGTERHESRRVDRQLRGRAGRQGDVGSSQFFVSLEDNLMRLFGSDRIARIMDRMGLEEGEVIQHSMITRSIERAQKKVEQSNFAIRKRLLEYDNVMNAQREIVYKKRKHALLGQRLHLDIMSMIYDTVEDLSTHHGGTLDHKTLQLNLLKIFGKEVPIAADGFSSEKKTGNGVDHLYRVTLQLYNDKKAAIQTKAWPMIRAMHQTSGKTLKAFSMPFSDGETVLYITADLPACVASEAGAFVEGVEKTTLLHFMDQSWKEHLREMDDLKQSVQNAVYERQDPLLIYKFEGYTLFQQFIQKVNQATVSFLNKANLALQSPDEAQAIPHKDAQVDLQESKQSAASLLDTHHGDGPGATVPAKPRKSQKIASRNERVTVRYADGTVQKNVKFKTVAEDIANERCVLIEDA